MWKSVIHHTFESWNMMSLFLMQINVFRCIFNFRALNVYKWIKRLIMSSVILLEESRDSVVFRKFVRLKSYTRRVHLKYILLPLLLFNYVLFDYYYTTTVDFDLEKWRDSTRRYSPEELQRPHHLRGANLDCAAMVAGDSETLRRYVDEGRYVAEDFPPSLSMSCQQLRLRILPNRTELPVKNAYAISRVVNKDYYWLESSLSHTYSPHNQYCFAVDQEMPDRLFHAIKQWQKCFPNVVVADKRYSFNSEGHYINYGHVACTELLLERKGWKYLMWIQNHDIVLRTNREMSDIIEFLNGSQSIGRRPYTEVARFDTSLNWTASGLKLWKNESRMSARQRNARLVFAQNYNEVLLSRQIVEFVMGEMNIYHLLDALENPSFATDELLWATLIATMDLELPGVPEKGCHDRRYYILRFNQWRADLDTRAGCKSIYYRHNNCIFGVEYLQELSGLHQIIGNKVFPSFDYGTVVCMGQLLRNRTFLNYPSPPSLSIYTGSSKDFC